MKLEASMVLVATFASRYRTIIAWSVYFVLLLCGAFPQGLSTSANGNGVEVPVLMTADEIVATDWRGDFATYVRGGQTLLYDPTTAKPFDTSRWMFLDPSMPLNENGWLRNWAPGMYFLHAALYKLWPSGPIFLELGIISCALWATVLAVVASRFAEALKGHEILAYLLIGSAVFLPSFRFVVCQAYIYSEPFSMGLMILSLVALLSAVKDNNINYYVMSGLLLGGASYMRGVTLNIATIFIICLIILALYKLLRSFNDGIAAYRRSSTIGVALVSIAYFGSLMPYYIYNHGAITGYNFLWDMPFAEKLEPALKEGGFDAVCLADPKGCDRMRREIEPEAHVDQQTIWKLTDNRKKRRSFVVLAPVMNLPFFITYKVPIAAKYFFDRESLIFTTPQQRDIPQGLLYISAALAAMVICVKYKTTASKVLLIFLLVNIIVVFGISFVVHYEARYLHPLKMLMFCSLPLAWSLAASNAARKPNMLVAPV